MILVDTNVFIDIMGPDERRRDWAFAALADARGRGRVGTGPIVLAELVRYAAAATDLAAIPTSFGVEIVPWSVEASFLAGRAFQRHVARTGRGGSVLADFLIGGHAEALGAAVLTRDPRLLRQNFPDVALITPD